MRFKNSISITLLLFALAITTGVTLGYAYPKTKYYYRPLPDKSAQRVSEDEFYALQRKSYSASVFHTREEFNKDFIYLSLAGALVLSLVTWAIGIQRTKLQVG